MNKIVNINIGGTPFIVDENAYDLLKNYLKTLSDVFRGQEDCAIIEMDIEQRISELLSDKSMETSNIVSVDDIQKVIKRIGEPREFIDETELENGGSNESKENMDQPQTLPPLFEKQSTPLPPPPVPDPYTLKKRLFRDPREKILGGVCSGLAHYLGIDPVWVRLIAVVLGFISFSTLFIIYIILWIIIPPARTPFEEMQMYGETTTLSNIGHAVNGIFDSSNKYFKSKNTRSKLEKIIRSFGTIGKILLIIIALAAIPIALGIILILATDLVGLILYPFNSGILLWLLGSFGDLTLPGAVLFYELLLLSICLIIGSITIAIIWCACSLNLARPIFSRKFALTLTTAATVGVIIFGILWMFSYNKPEYIQLHEPAITKVSFEDHSDNYKTKASLINESNHICNFLKK